MTAKTSDEIKLFKEIKAYFDQRDSLIHEQKENISELKSNVNKQKTLDEWLK